MLQVRFRYEGEVYHGEVVDDGYAVDRSTFDPEQVDVLPPSDPTKVVAVGKNYADHVQAVLDDDVVERDPFPLLFFKPASAVVGHRDAIRYPESSNFLDYEAELGVVIDRECTNVTEEEALDYVRGYTCVNDVTARDWQAREDQWVRAKGADTFCPMGPYLQTELNGSLDVISRVNGEVRQESNTENFLFSIPELIAAISEFVTLETGDLIATGTPAGTAAEEVPMDAWPDRSGEAALEHGDRVEVEIQSIGTLVNEIV
jgi:2-keto-4-pentenoate hydratase/2-oxohepta-3-ene-1,7-dioic acid hydratase in catechol pathway